MRHRIVQIALLCVAVTTFVPLVVSAGVLADVYAKKAASAVYKTEVYDLSIGVTPKYVGVDRCVDGIRIWYTRSETQRDDNQDSRIVRLRESMQRLFPGSKVWTNSPSNCADDPTPNRVRFWHEGDVTPAFFDAVEQALNELGMGKVVAKPKAEKK